jgi:hypothetical protein
MRTRFQEIKMRGAFAALIFCISSANAFASNEALVGDWFTEGDENGVHAQFIIHNQPDNTFTKEVRTFVRCNVADFYNETGTWSFDGKNYTEITKTAAGTPVDGTQSYFNDSFEYASIDSNHFDMHDPKTGITWLMTRVSSDYQFPSAKGCTV